MMAVNRTHWRKMSGVFLFSALAAVVALIAIFHQRMEVLLVFGKSKNMTKKHSWGRCVHVHSCLNYFKQHNTLARPCAVDLISRPQPLWKESLIDFFRGLRGHGASFFTVAAMGSDDCVLPPFDSVAPFHRVGTSGASGRCIGGVISGERTRRSPTHLTLTSCKCWRALRWAGNRGKESRWQFLTGASAEPATTTVPVFMQKIINYWSQPLKASFSDGIQEKLVTCDAISASCTVPVRGAKPVLGSINRSEKRSFEDSSNPSDLTTTTRPPHPLPIIVHLLQVQTSGLNSGSKVSLVSWKNLISSCNNVTWEKIVD